jgi:replicative DNA helicase
MADKLPPHDREMERCLIGVCLRNNAALAEAMSRVRVDDFYMSVHQFIIRAAMELADAGKPFDSAILADFLRARGQLGELGDSPYDFLAEIYQQGTAANLAYYADKILGKAMLRRLAAVCRDVGNAAEDGATPPLELVESAERQFFAIGQAGFRDNTVTHVEAVNAAVDVIDDKLSGKAGKWKGTRTGLIDLDRLTGGFQPGSLTVIAARPSNGKTALALSIMRHLAVEEGVSVFFASLEQPIVELGARLLVSHSGVDSGRVQTGQLSKEDVAMLARGREELTLARGRIYIDDSGAQTMFRIAANARRHKLSKNISACFIDYLQLVEPESRREPRHEQIGVITKRAKNLAKDLNIPLVLLAQISRKAEDRPSGRPRLSDLKDSGDIEQDADTVILLHREDDGQGKESAVQQDGPVVAIVAKQRNGPTGEVSLYFRRSTILFENFSFGNKDFDCPVVKDGRMADPQAEPE